MNTIPCSVGILTFNSGATLRRALESVRDFAEIIICDGGSTDDTRAIAQDFGARIIEQDAAFKNADGRLKDFSGVRNQCLDAATYDWFLYIDSDETISDGLREEVRSIASLPWNDGNPMVYKVPYGIVMDGRPIKHASNYPGYQHRFFNRRSGARFGKPVHERIFFDYKSTPVGTLSCPWYAYSTRELARYYLRETAGYRALEANSMRSKSFASYPHFVYKNMRVAAGVLLRSVYNYVRYGFGDSAPLADEVGRFLSPLFLIGLVTRSLVLDALARIVQGVQWFVGIPLRAHYFRKLKHATKHDIERRRAEAEMFLLPELLERFEGAFVDVGAHAGAYVYVAAGSKSRRELYAFEPQISYVRRLKRLFPGVHVEACALSNRCGEVSLKVPQINGSTYPARGTLEQYTEEGESGATCTRVPVTTLDAYCREHAVGRVGVIKIDVEGHEQSVLEGAEELLRAQHPALIVEIEQRHHHESIQEIFSYIESLGYDGWFVDVATETLRRLGDFSVAEYQDSAHAKTARQVNNFLFIPKDALPPQALFPWVRPLCVYVLPARNDRDKYIQLWQDALRRYATQPLVLSGVRQNSLWRIVLSRRIGARAVVCVHWSTVLYGSRFPALSLLYIVSNWLALKVVSLLGIKLVWFVHNDGAHDYPHPRIDALGRAMLWRRADAVVVHQETTKKRFALAHPNTRIVYIPMGGYSGAYGPRHTNRAEARAAYGLDKKSVVLLSFGMIRPYKKTEMLIQAVHAAAAQAKNLVLWVVGKGNVAYIETLQSQAQDSSHIRIDNRFIPDEELPQLFAAADFGIWQYDASELTSGAMTASLNYGLPVIVRNIAAAECVVDGENGFVYETQDELVKILGQLSKQAAPSPEMVLSTMTQFGWKRTAGEILDLCEEITCE